MPLSYWLLRRQRLKRIEKATETNRNVAWLRRMKEMDDSDDVKRIGEFAAMDAKNRKRRKD